MDANGFYHSFELYYSIHSLSLDMTVKKYVGKSMKGLVSIENKL